MTPNEADIDVEKTLNEILNDAEMLFVLDNKNVPEEIKRALSDEFWRR